MPYSVRLMSQEDVAQVSEIDREVFYSQWPPPNYRRELENKLAYYLVACDESKTVAVKPVTGFLPVSRFRKWLGRRCSSTNELPRPRQEYIVGFSGIWVMAGEAHLTNIAVRKDYQHQGIGELLLISVIDLAQELNAEFMTLEVRASNTVAQSLYRKYGFTQVGLRRGYYRDNHEDAIIMSTPSFTAASFRRRFQQLKQAHATKWSGKFRYRESPTAFLP